MKNKKPHYELRDCETGKIIKGKEVDAMCQPDYSKQCEICGKTPVLPLTGLCGPCTFGEADTADGNW